MTSAEANRILLQASQHGDISAVRAALTKGAAIDARDHSQQTPLHYAAFNGHIDLALLLIAEGAAVNATDHYQLTPLHLATYSDHLDLVRILEVAAKFQSAFPFQMKTKPAPSTNGHWIPRHGDK